MTITAASAATGIFAHGLWNWITVTFFGILFVGFLLAAVTLLVYYVKDFKGRAKSLSGILNDAEADPPSISRSRTRAVADERDRKVLGPLWREFDETLVTSRDGEIVYNTVEAAEFFNADTLALEITRNRLLAAVPGLLAAFGVFGTFLSLAIGLYGLDIGSGGSTSGPDNLGLKVQNLIGAAGFAFLKSVFGVGLSFVFTIGAKVIDGKVARQVASIQRRIDGLYRRTTPERSLVAIAESSRATVEEVQQLHERIGNRLQEAVQSVSSEIQNALNSAITSAMAPSMERLAQVTSAQSEAVFTSLVERFTSSFTDMGRRQRELMDQAADRLGSAIDAVGEQFGAVIEQTNDFLTQTERRQAEVLDGIRSMSDTLTSSTSDLRTASEALTSAGLQLETSGSALRQGLVQAADTLASIEQNAIENSVMMTKTHGQLQSSAATLEASSSLLRAAVDVIGDHVKSFEDAQREFHEALGSEMSDAADALHRHVAELENQVARWLSDYSSDVEKQIVDRMGTWDSVSRDYAEQILRVARTLGDVVDSFPVEQNPAIHPLEIEGAVS